MIHVDKENDTYTVDGAKADVTAEAAVVLAAIYEAEPDSFGDTMLKVIVEAMLLEVKRKNKADALKCAAVLIDTANRFIFGEVQENDNQ